MAFCGKDFRTLQLKGRVPRFDFIRVFRSSNALMQAIRRPFRAFAPAGAARSRPVIPEGIPRRNASAVGLHLFGDQTCNPGQSRNGSPFASLVGGHWISMRRLCRRFERHSQHIGKIAPESGFFFDGSMSKDKESSITRGLQY